MKNRLDAEGRWALLPVRLMVGFGFAAHGLAKLGRGPEKFAVILQALCLRHTWRRGRRRFSSSQAASA